MPLSMLIDVRMSERINRVTGEITRYWTYKAYDIADRQEQTFRSWEEAREWLRMNAEIRGPEYGKLKPKR